MPKKTASKIARPRKANAGMPQSGARMRGAMRAPSKADLDRRDRLKVGPRRPAGPPLGGDVPEAEPVKSMRSADLGKPTTPKSR